jgi:hypothetical protein
MVVLQSGECWKSDTCDIDAAAAFRNWILGKQRGLGFGLMCGEASPPQHRL